MGVDYHYTGKNFIVLASFFEGEGPACQRIRIDTISQGWYVYDNLFCKNIVKYWNNNKKIKGQRL